MATEDRLAALEAIYKAARACGQIEFDAQARLHCRTGYPMLDPGFD